MAFNVEIGLMDLWKLTQWASAHVGKMDNPDLREFLEIKNRFPQELKQMELQNPEKTIDV